MAAVLYLVRSLDVSAARLGDAEYTSQLRCPPCDLIFAGSQPSTGAFRHLDIKVRGEPKSGTGFMLEWAASALFHARDYLRDTFGEGSCGVHFVMDPSGLHDLSDCTFRFAPTTFVEDSTPCTCNSIEM